jgi:hypothetical protein
MARAQRARCVALLLSITVAGAWAADTLHGIALHHRPASEILPIVRPLLKPHEAMSGSAYQVFVRADAARVAEIERLVAALDVAERQLTITVRQTLNRHSERAHDRGTGEVAVGRSGTDADVHYHGERREHTGGESRAQMLRVLDGRRAFLRLGQSLPVVQRVVALTGRGDVIAAQGVSLHEMSTGFEVLPRVRGDTVVLEITPQLAAPRAADGAFRFHELRTTVTARLGEWIDLGAATARSSEVNRTILGRGDAHGSETTTVWLKVE